MVAQYRANICVQTASLKSIDPLLCFQPVELTKKRSDVATPRGGVDESSCNIHNRLKPPKKVLGDACKCCISVIQTNNNKR